MKKVNQYMRSIAFLLALFCLFGCEDFYDINTSKDTPSYVTVDQALPPILLYTSQITYDYAEYGVYLAQALTTGGNSATNSYGYKGGWSFLTMNRHPQWRRHFYDIGSNSESLFEAAEKAGNAKNYILIARTLRLYSTLLTTDTFGDMPRSEAYKSLAPKYDTQESIYDWMFQEVDELIDLYNNEEWTGGNNLIITQKTDRIFGGDMGKWRAFTKAIKARIMLRKLPNWDNTHTACDAIINAVDDALNDPSYQDALYRYPGGENESNCPWGPAQPTLNLGWAQARANLLKEAIPSKFFVHGILGGYSRYGATRGYALDPRASILMTPRGDAVSTNKVLRYLECNIGIPTDMKTEYYPDLYTETNLNGPTNPYTQNTSYIMLMSKEELLFIKAEAQYWKSDISSAYHTTVEAVEANMQRMNVQQTTTTQKNIYKRFMDVKLPGAGSFSIADLMQQKYVAMYLQPEMWTDLRRYNYSSPTNGIRYNGIYVYEVTNCHNGTNDYNAETGFNATYALARPYNLNTSYWLTNEDFGTGATNSPNAWVTRLNYDPETEEKYNKSELERLGAYQNYKWLKKRMIWAYKNNSYVTTADPTEWQ